MYLTIQDNRRPLQPGDRVEMVNGSVYLVDFFAGSGGFALTYIAHEADSPQYVALKELFPVKLEDAVAVRREDGRIVITHPLSGTGEEDDPSIWKSVLPYFEREAKLTRKAALLYDGEGCTIRQNNPDVLSIHGPTTDVNGNHYLILDTSHGQSFASLIEEGWENAEDRGACVNNSLGDVIDVLIKVSLHLSRLHRDNKLLHLDLSPANIYLTERNAGTALEPYIIDYGSALEIDASRDAAGLKSHRFTMNPYSAPEVKALADLNDPDSGYWVDQSSDTYPLCAILLYAAAGTEPRDARFASKWKSRIRALFPAEIYQGNGKEPFAESLIAILGKGLSSNQAKRFRTADELCRALRELKDGFQRIGILNRMDRDTLMSYLALEKFPLFDYGDSAGELRFLCLGSGAMVNRFILSAISCAQMLRGTLHIHVAAKDHEGLRQSLLTAAPALGLFSNLSGQGDPAAQYVDFTFDSFSEEPEARAVRELLAAHTDCRYFVVSTGSDRRNLLLAEELAQQLSADESRACLIHYYTEEDAAKTIRPIGQNGKVGSATLSPLGIMTPAYRKSAEVLGWRAFRVSYLYSRLFAPSVNRSKLLREFILDDYGQNSSAAAALHMSYKLKSLRIDRKKSRAEIAKQYFRKAEENMGALMELEHRRWMMYMAADGYSFPGTLTQDGQYKPDLKEIDRNSFCEEYTGSNERSYNKKFHSVLKKRHPCMVPCSVKGVVLPRDHAFWDNFTSVNDILKTDYDPIDKISLSLHLLAGSKIARSSFIDSISYILNNKIGRLIEDLLPQSASLNSAFEKFKALCLAVPKTKSLKNYEVKKQALLAALGEVDESLSLEPFLKELDNEFAVVKEFVGYKDYKAPDEIIIRGLPWVMFSLDHVTLVKMPTEEVVSKTALAMMLEPEKLICCNMPEDDNLRTFFKGHGDNTSVDFSLRESSSYSEMAEDILRLRAKNPGPFAIDITGSDGLCAVAAIRASEKDRSIGVVRYNPEADAVENIANFPFAAVYSQPAKLSVSEAYLLHGAKRAVSGEGYLYELRKCLDALWSFYLKHIDDWEMISDFFKIHGSPKAEVEGSGILIDSNTRWEKAVLKNCADSVLNSTGMRRILNALEQNNVIRELDFSSDQQTTKVSYFYPPELEYLKLIVPKPVNLTYHWDLSKNPKNGRIRVVISSRLQFFASLGDTFENRETKKIFQKADMLSILNELQQLGLITGLKVSKHPSQDKDKITFYYASNAVWDVLSKAGNILEAYVWEQAAGTGYFDDVRANFMFRWPEGDVSNELDVLAAKGLSTLVVSCKTAKFKKEHLYEVKYLADRFSVNTKAVIVYSSDRAVKESNSDSTVALRKRAAAMGIYMISRNILESGTLGQVLVQIAAGQITPQDLFTMA